METLLLSANATMTALNGGRQLQLLQSQSRLCGTFIGGCRERYCPPPTKKYHNRSQFVATPAAQRMLTAAVIDDAPKTTSGSFPPERHHHCHLNISSEVIRTCSVGMATPKYSRNDALRLPGVNGRRQERKRRRRRSDFCLTCKQ